MAAPGGDGEYKQGLQAMSACRREEFARITLAGFLALGLAGSAGAATLPYSGIFLLQLANIPGLAAPAGGLAVVNGTGPLGHLATLSIGAGAFGPVTISVPVTTTASINSVIFTGMANLAGTGLAVSGGGVAGPMGLAGTAKICLLFAPCAYASVPIPLTPVSGVGVGIGGTQVVPGAVALTMQHASWTIGQPTITIHGPTSTVWASGQGGSAHSPGSSTWTFATGLPGGFAHGPATLTSSSALRSGVVQLVTITKTYTTLTTLLPEMPLVGILQLHFVPEPGTLLLLGLGVAALAAVGRRIH